MRSGENADFIIRKTTAGAAQGATANELIGSVPYAGVVKSVKFIPVTGITGAADNTRLLRLYNRGAGGAGTTIIASYQFDATMNSTAKVPKALTLGVAANRVVAAGDVLEANSAHVGTGIADAGGVWEITITRS